MKHKLDNYAIRMIHHHGQLSRDYELPTTSPDYRKTLKLAMSKLELELLIDYKLTLPNGIATTD